MVLSETARTVPAINGLKMPAASPMLSMVSARPEKVSVISSSRIDGRCSFHAIQRAAELELLAAELAGPLLVGGNRGLHLPQRLLQQRLRLAWPRPGFGQPGNPFQLTLIGGRDGIDQPLERVEDAGGFDRIDIPTGQRLRRTTDRRRGGLRLALGH